MHIFKHFGTVTKHRFIVFAHSLRAGIPWRGLVHDLSKYTPTEFIPGAKYYKGTRSPIGVERKDNGYSAAWLHHKGRNRHHYEYWMDYSPALDTYVPVEMPTKYVIEMFCDMLAANKVYKGKSHSDSDAIEYFYSHKMDVKMHENSAKLLETLFMVLAQQGEKAAFRYIRKLKRQVKRK